MFIRLILIKSCNQLQPEIATAWSSYEIDDNPDGWINDLHIAKQKNPGKRVACLDITLHPSSLERAFVIPAVQGVQHVLLTEDIITNHPKVKWRDLKVGDTFRDEVDGQWYTIASREISNSPERFISMTDSDGAIHKQIGSLLVFIKSHDDGEVDDKEKCKE